MKHSEVKKDFKSPYMKKVWQRLSKLKMNAEELANYYKYMKDLASQQDAVSAAAAEAKGRAEEAINIAIKMLKNGVSIEDFSKFTELSVAKIKKLI
jgi:hypothetical protein